MKEKRLPLILGILCLALIITALPFMSACAKPAPPVKPIELTYSHMFPSAYGQALLIEDWAKEIEKRTEGRVKITVYPGSTLTKAPECYEGVVKGTSDIGLTCLAYTRGRFPLMEVIDLPGYRFNAMVTTRVADDLYKKFKPTELADTHVLYLYAHIPGVISTTKKPVRTLEELKGMKIRATGLSAKIVEALGAVPVTMPKEEQYEALRKGTADGTTNAPNELKGWKTAEVCKYTTIVPDVGYVTAFWVGMNLGRWNTLPKDIQKIFTEVSEEWVSRTGERWNEMELEGYKYGKEQGHVFIYPPPEECARWVAACKPLAEKYLKDMEAKGLPGREALDYRQELIEKYGKMYPPLKFD